MSTMTMTTREVFEQLRETEQNSPTGPSTMIGYDERAEHYAYSLPERSLTYLSIPNMRTDVIDSGSHYFDRDAVRFFRGRTDRQLIGGRFWVESRQYVDRDGDASPREYQVAWVSQYGDNLSVEKLGSFDTLDKARRAARRLSDSIA